MSGAKQLLSRSLRMLLTPIRARDFYRTAEDRVLLEQILLPYIAAQDDLHRILFVGCEWYTKHYEHVFSAKEYWTLEPDAAKRRFGGARHITASLRELGACMEPDCLDVIICNGVFMITAMETRAEAEPSFDACFETLRPGGLFVLGWNDTPALRPYAPADSAALGRFDPFVMPPLGVAQFRTNTDYRHVYNFYCRPVAGA